VPVGAVLFALLFATKPPDVVVRRPAKPVPPAPVASVRILEKLAFQRTEVRPGAFGDMLLFRLTVEVPAGDPS